MARPRKNVDALQVLALRLEGVSFPEIARLTSWGKGRYIEPTGRRWSACSLSKTPRLVG